MDNFIRAWWCFNPNFGDALTPYIAEKISGKKVIYTEPHADIEKDIYMVTGSILNWDCPTSVVWGCGVAAMGDGVPKRREIKAVRGPLSRLRALSCGTECPEVYGDPGLLLPRLYTPETGKKYKAGIIPHYIDLEKVTCMGLPADILVIDLRQDVETVIDQVNSCEYIGSSSLHGLVVADAYGIPNRWIKIDDRIGGDGLKYIDYYMSINRNVYLPEVCDNKRNMMELAMARPVAHEGIQIDLDLLYNNCPFL